LFVEKVDFATEKTEFILENNLLLRRTTLWTKNLLLGFIICFISRFFMLKTNKKFDQNKTVVKKQPFVL
jgi:hypothetical protein